MTIPSSIVPDDDRDRILHVLQVTTEQLHEAIEVGYIHKSTSTDAEPAGAGSYYVWSKGTAQLRYTLAPFGWTWDSIQNFQRTLREDGRVAIALSSGNAATGLADATPHTRNPKGPTMRTVVEQNQQLSLFDPVTLKAVSYEETPEPECETWLLLHFQDPHTKEIRVELSLPTEMSGQHISSWRHRILLPSLQPDPQVDVDDDQDDGDDAINVDVRSRGPR